MVEDGLLRGVYNIAPTPFNPDGSLDLESVPKLTEFLIRTGVNGITILGVMGETAKISDEERDRVIADFIEAADGRVPICVGATHAATGCCIAYCRRAQEMGAIAVMVAPPKMTRSNDATLRRHYLAIAEAVDIPVVVQDHPESSGVHMRPEFVAALADEAPQCRFLKLEDEPSPPKITAVLALNPNLKVFGGLGGIMFLEELRRGAIGTMTGFGFPEILVRVYMHHAEGNLGEAATTFYKYCPLIRFENQPGISLSLRKYVYYLRGAIASAQPREPFARLDEGTIEELDTLIGALELVK